MTGQAEIVSAIARFRATHAPDPSVPHWESRTEAATAYERLVREVEWKLIESLLQLARLLRPLIQRRWAAMVAQVNRLEESQLELFLFGAARAPTARVRAGLWEIQTGRCFYCEGRIADPSRGEVDHFIPGARYPDDGLDNLVVADRRCNGQKRNSLAATSHVARWAGRLVDGAAASHELAALASETGWTREAGDWRP